ncbi:MAG: UDP-N-acetylglucosamine 2-epimerase (non-hydrolyzing) [Myxococcales bacterium]|nr:UDP-N-acetylglucosamine 2-epimerase (non-hydrolyzing) [Myxococcales bacterium]
MSSPKVMTILGTRPEIIRLSSVIPVLDGLGSHVLVHTGQNYDDRLSKIFFEDLEVRAPDVYMGVRAASFGGQIGQILEKSEDLFREHRPDRLLILGDTNSGVAAIVARRLGIPVFHMEAGNRCFDDRVPEEVNRRIIDHSSSVLMPYTERSRANLLAEGVASDRIYVTGNPIGEVIERFSKRIDASGALEQLGLKPQQYFLVTMHRAENVDVEARLRGLTEALHRLHDRWGYPVVCSVHPRTRNRMAEFGLQPGDDGVRYMEPFGFFDFVRLEQQAFCLLSDSGTVQEEACLFGVPNVTIRDVTERPETIECGSNVLASADPDTIFSLVDFVTKTGRTWTPPPEYTTKNVADTVCRIVTGFRLPDRAEEAWQSWKTGV